MRKQMIKMASVLTLAAALCGGGTAASAAGAGYHPAQTYPGPYVPNVVYYRNCSTCPWQRGLSGLYSQGVKCSDALRNLGRTGRWWGHFKQDGSCGPIGEPSEFALGNRLNYESGGQ
jgi:hypothetical protein